MSGGVYGGGKTKVIFILIMNNLLQMFKMMGNEELVLTKRSNCIQCMGVDEGGITGHVL